MKPNRPRHSGWPRHAACNRAFTLIELVVVIALMTIVLAFALPRLDVSFITNEERTLSAWIVLNVKSLKETALRDQAPCALCLDFEAQTLWTEKTATPSASDKTDDAENADASIETKSEGKTASDQGGEPAKGAPFRLPEGFQLLDVEFPDDRKERDGIVRIHFYPKGYCEKAVVHVQNPDDSRTSYLIESFLPHVQILEEYTGF